MLVTEEEFNLISKEEGTISLLGVRDNNGKEGVVQGISTIVVSEMPEATIEGGGLICEGEKSNLTISGEASDSDNDGKMDGKKDR